ncbi:hypothetical protein LX16_2946 [Stackebrandtia albiflava]|uniref:Peptide subunit release factor 1 (ERF1) n=1 Tax=Stackebrandtia albiflava TaxID=406432 RepID=A0A562V2U8_9ACTN|nr:VLRF1 family aeRF1-type release factor [Stackebrandtia albiflava]TWJ12191.1 hypothetical protein LX16_2946 [Stackebrandtia albiflava]
MNLDRSSLRELAGLSDPLGVLSIYVTADPTEEASDRPAWELRLRNALDELSAAAKDSGDREFDQTMRRKLPALEPDLDWLTAGSTPGLGRALFAPLSADEVYRISVQQDLGDRVVCDDTGYVRPLLSAWAAGAPAGVAVAAGEGLRILEVEFGRGEELATLEYDDPSGEWREMRGPARNNPMRSQQSSSQTDLFDSKRAAHLKRFLATGHESLRRFAEERDWGFLVLAGEPQLRDAVVERLASGFGPQIVISTQVLGQTTPAQVADMVADDLATARRDRDLGLVNRIEETKLSTRGLDQTLAAVQDGRAELVVMDTEGQWHGRRTPDGLFVGGDTLPPDTDPDRMQDEPDLGERLIELALRNSTEVAMVPPEVAERLNGADGLAAVLRW